jgi:hypothetical protein
MSKLIFFSETYIRYEYTDEDNNNFPNDWEANFTWTGRDDYLEWVAEWKDALKAQIKLIRDQKAIRSDKTAEISDRNAANLKRQQLRIDCHNLLLMRKIGKRRSARQRADLKLAA